MADIKINPEYKDQRTHSGTCGKCVGERNQDELVELGILARKSNNPVLLRCFIDLPTMDELVQSKTSADIKAVSDNTLSKAVSTPKK